MKTVFLMFHYYFILLFSTTVVATVFDKDECMVCVKQDCTYCRGSDFFDNPSVCHCEEFDGTFGSCDDYSFGSDPYTKKSECTSDGRRVSMTLIIILVTTIPSILIIFFIFCTNCCRKGKTNDLSSTAAANADAFARAQAAHATVFPSAFVTSNTFTGAHPTANTTTFSNVPPFQPSTANVSVPFAHPSAPPIGYRPSATDTSLERKIDGSNSIFDTLNLS
jgi:hypothetical protein